MTVSGDRGLVQVAERSDGTLLYCVDAVPGRLPPVRRRDLLAAWDAAREHARGGHRGVGRFIRFAGGAATTELALNDPDARCWAAAADACAGLHTTYGLSLCLRLLALVEVVARVPAAARLVRVAAGEAILDPGLVGAAATSALDETGRFDADALLGGEVLGGELLAGACPAWQAAAAPERMTP